MNPEEEIKDFEDAPAQLLCETCGGLTGLDCRCERPKPALPENWTEDGDGPDD